MPKQRRPRVTRWALQDAKNRFSEVVEAALRGEPQVVTRRGIETAVVISHDEYTRLTAAVAADRPPLATYLLSGATIDESDAQPFERIVLRPRRS